jgi:hypothetical protein
VRWLLVIALAGCGRIGFDATGGDGGSTGGFGATDASFGTAGVGGGGTVNGSGPMGMPFGPVAAAYSIGHPEVPGQTWIYMFSAPIACDALSRAGWGSRIGNTQILVFEIGGTAPGAYFFMYSDPPPSQQAYSKYYSFSNMGIFSAGGLGSGDLSMLGFGVGGVVLASFNLSDSGGFALNGEFAAAPCITGYPP